MAPLRPGQLPHYLQPAPCPWLPLASPSPAPLSSLAPSPYPCGKNREGSLGSWSLPRPAPTLPSTAACPHPTAPGLPGSQGPQRKQITFLRALCQAHRFPLPSPDPPSPLALQTQLCTSFCPGTMESMAPARPGHKSHLRVSHLPSLDLSFLTHRDRASLVAQLVKNPPAMQETPV